jgi:Rogdi leucine zipper containing protein
LQSLKAGLDEIAVLLAPARAASSDANAETSLEDTTATTATTLALSTHRSESLKGFVTRAGARLRKGELRLRLPGLAALHSPRGAPHFAVALAPEPIAPPVVLQQIVAARERIVACLDVVDVAAWGGDASDPQFIAGQLRLLDVNLQEAKAALKGGTQLPWYKDAVDETVGRGIDYDGRRLIPASGILTPAPAQPVSALLHPRRITGP